MLRLAVRSVMLSGDLIRRVHTTSLQRSRRCIKISTLTSRMLTWRRVDVLSYRTHLLEHFRWLGVSARVQTVRLSPRCLALVH